jgi:hypothetical protein
MVITTVIEYIALAIVLLGGLSVIGWPIKELLVRLGGLSVPMTAPLAGLCVLQVVGWYWFEAGGRGLAIPTSVLLFAGTLGAGWLLWRKYRAGRVERRDTVFAVAALAAAGAVTAINFYALFHLSYLTTATIGNGDAANYAIVGQHLASHGFSDMGPIVGSNLGEVGRTDGFGSTVLIGAFSAVTGLGTWKLTTGVILTLGILATYHLALLLKELMPRRDVLSVVAAALVSGTFLFVYIQAQAFTGQVMAMACLPIICLVGLRAGRATSTRSLIAIGIAGAIVLLVMLSHYAVMAVLAPAVVLPAMVVADGVTREDWSWTRTLVRRLVRLVLVFGSAGLAAFALVPEWLTIAYQRADVIGGANVGWPLGSFLPVEMLGLGTRMVTAPNAIRIAASAAILVVFGAAAWFVRRSDGRLARFGTAAVVGMLLSYLVVYLNQRDASYRLWKWATFFQPLFAALVVAMIVSAIVGARVRLPRLAPAAAFGALAVFAVGVVFYSGVIRDSSTGFVSNMRGEALVEYATIDEWALSRNAFLKRLDAVNVALGPVDQAWSLYFTPTKRINPQYPTSYSVAPPDADWTIVANAPAITGDMFVPVNDAYRLMRTPRGPTSKQPVGLDAAIAVDGSPQGDIAPGGATVIPLTIRNIGTATWETNGPVGVVNIGAHLYDASGRLITMGWIHQSLPISQAGPVVPPGATVQAKLIVPPLPSGNDVIQVQMVSEGIAWFGVRVPVSASA